MNKELTIGTDYFTLPNFGDVTHQKLKTEVVLTAEPSGATTITTNIYDEDDILVHATRTTLTKKFLAEFHDEQRTDN